MPLLQRVWNAVREVYFFLKPIRFVLIPLIALLAALIWSDQGQDAIRFLVEVDRQCPHYGRIVIFLIVVSATGLQAWYWSRQMLRIDSIAGRAAKHPRGERWMPRLIGASVFLIALGALVRAAWLGWNGQIDFAMKVNLATSITVIILLAGFLAFVVIRRRVIGPSPHVATHAAFDPITILILRATAIAALVFVIWTAISPLTAGSAFQSPSLLILSAALWIGIGTWLAYWFDTYRVPLATTLLIFAIVFSCFNDNHMVRTLGDPFPARQPLDATFETWYRELASRYPDEADHPVFIVATEGGGVRAAYWTAAVLTAIEDQAPQFSDHIFGISSVSGGSVGSMVFTALVADRSRGPIIPECDANVASDRTFRRAAQEMLSYDALAPTLGSMLHADLVQRFLPIGFIPDRARALETGWEKGWRTRLGDDFFGKGMLQMYAGRGQTLLPSLFLNGTSVESGNRRIASNCDLRDGQIPDAVDLFDELGRDMRLSTAAHNSARFTYVSPAGTVRNKSRSILGHVVDGGYFENSGAATATNVIQRLAAIRGARPYSLHLILIKFCDIDKASCDGRCLPPPSDPEHFMNEVMSPLRALLATRGARGTLAYAEAMGLPGVGKYEFILTQETHGIVLPLGWLLARRTRKAIDAQVGPAPPANLDCATRKFVERNSDNLWTIVTMVNPPLKAKQRAPDAIQREAAQ
ncbi:MAG TPA: patatin-like phospholipase family protein [Thermoanaerobaculia bacterium]